jgi:prepilin-type N-terminal cleavage/methylation domain-containing protein
MMKSSKNNHGFSLVELIIVIAIMAVLVSLLAPQYLKYVERARLQKAISNTKTVTDAITALLTDSAANTTSLYDQLTNALTGTADGTHEIVSHNGYNAVKIDLADSSDPLAALILKEIGNDASFCGILYFYQADNIPSFSFEMQDGKLAVDYNPPSSSTHTYLLNNGDYHAYYKD